MLLHCKGNLGPKSVYQLLLEWLKTPHTFLKIHRLQSFYGIDAQGQ